MTDDQPVVEWDVAERHGKMLVDLEGEKIGKLQDVYVDVETDVPQFATVKEGFHRPAPDVRAAGWDQGRPRRVAGGRVQEFRDQHGVGDAKPSPPPRQVREPPPPPTGLVT